MITRGVMICLFLTDMLAGRYLYDFMFVLEDIQSAANLGMASIITNVIGLFFIFLLSCAEYPS